MNTNTNTAAINDFLKNANVSQEVVATFHPDVLSKLIKDYPNPKEFRKELSDITFKTWAKQVFEHNSMACDLAMFLYEDYPEYFITSKINTMVGIIKNEVARAEKENLNDAFTEHIKENYAFSKFKKIKSLVEEELANVPDESLGISLHEFALNILPLDESEQIFENCGFDYSTKYVYGDEKEVKLDGELRLLIWEIYNKTKHQ